MADPAPHPLPPTDFDVRALRTHSMGPPRTLWRSTLIEHAEAPLFFGTSGAYRFDDPERAFGVCYIAATLAGAFLETFARVPRDVDFIITQEALDGRAFREIYLKAPLEVLDITGPNLAIMGADNRLASGGDYACLQAWSRAIHDHPAHVDGLLYRSRHDPLPSGCLRGSLKGAAAKVVIATHYVWTQRQFRPRIGEIFSTYAFSLG